MLALINCANFQCTHFTKIWAPDPVRDLLKSELT